MYIFLWYPIPTIILFSIYPLVGGFIGYVKAIKKKTTGNARKKEILAQVSKGVGIGLLIDLPFFCFVIWGFSAM